jgi:preprotein translocase subunit SecG
MTTLLIIVHVLVCLFLIGIVLLQHGKGADIGATFGGSSQSLFGSEGPVPLLNKITTFSAIIFMGTSISLAYLSANRSTGTVMSELKPAPVEQTVPAPQTEPVTIPMPAAQQAVSAEKAKVAPVEQQPVEQQAEQVPQKETDQKKE